MFLAIVCPYFVGAYGSRSRYQQMEGAAAEGPLAAKKRGKAISPQRITMSLSVGWPRKEITRDQLVFGFRRVC
jgi:hypothetical protein